MDASATDKKSDLTTIQLLGISAISVLSYVLCDLLHELGHALATLMPVGVKAISISTIGLSSVGSSPVVAAAGPMVNLALAIIAFVACSRFSAPAWRYFAWLFGTVNLFNATAYLLYSSILGSGDWAVVFDSVAQPILWRPVAGLLGLILYAASVQVSLIALRRLCSSGAIAAFNVERYCNISYWSGGLILTIGAVFNPVSPWFILTSGAATGFGAMLGLLFLPMLLHRKQSSISSETELMNIGMSWVVAGALASIVFVGLVGPGIRLAT